MQDHDQPERAELVQLHRELLGTAAAPESHPERAEWHGRVMALLRSGVEPCLPRRTLVLPGGVGLPMVFIPSGSFLMGSQQPEAGGRGDESRHVVALSAGLWLGVTPVTQSQWRAVRGTDPSRFRGKERPVERVSWNDAQAFCAAVRDRLGVPARLPTEAEWEYAARAGTTTPFYWGGSLDGTQANCNGNYPYGTDQTGPYLETTTAVGRYAGVSPHPWGLADVIGNVLEFCEDWYEPYADGEAVDPVGPASGWLRACRGGSWDTFAGSCRAARRSSFETHLTAHNLGFRLAVGSSGQ